MSSFSSKFNFRAAVLAAAGIMFEHGSMLSATAEIVVSYKSNRNRAGFGHEVYEVTDSHSNQVKLSARHSELSAMLKEFAPSAVGQSWSAEARRYCEEFIDKRLKIKTTSSSWLDATFLRCHRKLPEIRAIALKKIFKASKQQTNAFFEYVAIFRLRAENVSKENCEENYAQVAHQIKNSLTIFQGAAPNPKYNSGAIAEEIAKFNDIDDDVIKIQYAWGAIALYRILTAYGVEYWTWKKTFFDFLHELMVNDSVLVSAPKNLVDGAQSQSRQEDNAFPSATLRARSDKS